MMVMMKCFCRMFMVFIARDSQHENLWHVKMKLNPLSANPTKWSNTLKQFVGKLPTNCLSVFDHFVGLVLKGLINPIKRF